MAISGITGMVTYRDGAKYRTNIVFTTDGAYEIWVQNMNSRYALELRKNSPEGEKIAYLTRNERYRQIKSPTNATMTLFPVWIAYNNVTKTIVSFTPSVGTYTTTAPVNGSSVWKKK
jgi:hypothetical protein